MIELERILDPPGLRGIEFRFTGGHGAFRISGQVSRLPKCAWLVALTSEGPATKRTVSTMRTLPKLAAVYRALDISSVRERWEDEDRGSIRSKSPDTGALPAGRQSRARGGCGKRCLPSRTSTQARLQGAFQAPPASDGAAPAPAESDPVR